MIPETNKNGFSYNPPPIKAVQKEKIEQLQKNLLALTKRPEMLNRTNREKLTPLELATKHNLVEVVKTLLPYRQCNLPIITKCLRIARQAQNQAMVDLLFQQKVCLSQRIAKRFNRRESSDAVACDLRRKALTNAIIQKKSSI